MVYFRGAVYFQAWELHLCSGSVIVSLQQNLKGGVLFVEAAPLDRHNCEGKQINLPRASNSKLSACHFFYSLPFPFPFLSIRLPCLDFHCFISFSHFVFHFHSGSHPSILTFLSSCASSPRLLGSHAVIPHHKWAVWMCTQPTNQEPTWEPFHTVPQHSPN